MVYTYTPTYYSSFQDTITSLCKSILPFGLRSRRPLPDQKLAKRHSDNLKWQQESFHRILHLIGLHNEGMVPEADVAAFRTHLLDTLLAAPAEEEPACVVRDKLLFLQELFYAKCISARQYHSSKRPLLQRIAAQGVELDCRDVIPEDPSTNYDEEWSVIELRDKEPAAAPVEKPKHRTPIKAFISNAASWRGKGKKDSSSSTRGPLSSVDVNAMDSPKASTDRGNDKSSVLMLESLPSVPVKLEKAKRKPFRAIFQKEQKDDNENNEPLVPEAKEKTPKPLKKQWGFDGLKNWKRSSAEEESNNPYFTPGERMEESSAIPCALVASPIGEGPDTKRIKKKIHSDGAASDFFIDKVLEHNIKKELSRIKMELNSKNSNLNFSDEQIDAISTRLPVDKSDLNNFFPKSWCDKYGDVVLDVVKKEFKDHISETETLQYAREKQCTNVAEKWVAFEEEDDENKNTHPNLFAEKQALLSNKVKGQSGDRDDRFLNNPFYDHQNPFCSSVVL